MAGPSDLLSAITGWLGAFLLQDTSYLCAQRADPFIEPAYSRSHRIFLSLSSCMKSDLLIV